MWRNVEESGTSPVGRVRGTPRDGPIAILNVRLRRCTIVLTAHAHMLFGIDIECNMEEAQSRRVHHGRSAFPST
jgi:hypothetical protein